VDDGEISELVRATLDHEHPREFYWALMDYGSWLKSSGAGRISQSKHYKKQSALKGSVREVRGQIIRVLAGGDKTEPELKKVLEADDRFMRALHGLVKDGLVEQTGLYLHLTK